MGKRLARSTTDRILAGVCGGVAEYFDIDSTFVRILWALFAVAGGSGVLLYILCAVLMPQDVDVY